MEVLFGHNTGLGDYILMNGALRWMLSQDEISKVIYLAQVCPNKRKHVQAMYSDIADHPKLNMILEPRGATFPHQRRKIKLWHKKFPASEIRAWAWGTARWRQGMVENSLDPDRDCWTEMFYSLCKVPYRARHKNAYIPRNQDREERLIKEIGIPKEFVFCADWGGSKRWRYSLEPETDLPIINPKFYRHLNLRYTMFDWMGILERASEIYTIDTGWFHLIKTMRLNKPKYLYNARGDVLRNCATSFYLNDPLDSGWALIDKNNKQLF